MSGVHGHVFVVGADLTRLACDDVLVPTDRSLRLSRGWCSLLPDDLQVAESDGGVRVRRNWHADERVLELPGQGAPRVWLIDTVDDGQRGLPWLLAGAREALAAVARRSVDRPAPRRAPRPRGPAGPGHRLGGCGGGARSPPAAAAPGAPGGRGGARFRRRAGPARTQRPGGGAARAARRRRRLGAAPAPPGAGRATR